MTRIRYKKNAHLLISTKPILCNERFVNITIDVSEMKYFIADANTSEVIGKGVEPNVQTLKRSVKSFLKSIGATFFDEVRNGKRERKLVIEPENSRLDHQ